MPSKVRLNQHRLQETFDMFVTSGPFRVDPIKYRPEGRCVMINKTMMVPALMFASGAALMLAGCESSGNYRVGWVGDNPPPGGSSGGGDGSSGGTASGGDSSGGGTSSGGGDGSSSGGASSGGASSGGASSGGASSGGASSGGASSGGASSGGATGGAGNLIGNLIVTAGNTVIGAAGKTDRVVRGGVLPTAGVVTGTVTGILAKTGQTLVKVGEGAGGTGGGLILDGVGGKLGALVGIDIGKGQVVSAPAGSKALIGVGVLAKNPSTGQLASVNALSGGKLLSVEVNGTGGLLGSDKGLLGGVTGTVGGVVNGVTGGVTGGVVSGVTAAATGASGSGLVGGVVNTVGSVVGGATGGGSNGTGGVLAPATGTVTGTVGGVVSGVTGAVTGAVGGLVGGGLTGAPGGSVEMPHQPDAIGGIVKPVVGTVGGVVGGVTGGLLKGRKR